MLSAHGSAPEVVAAARANGGYVVDAVCPLVTKVHHEVKVRAGKGYQIVYVGHEGHEEAVGTMAVAPDSIHRVESVDEVAALPAVRRPGRHAGPDHAQPPRLGRRARRHPGAVPRRCGCPDAATSASPPPTARRALMEIAARCDAVVVIGSANSSNTAGAREAGRGAGCAERATGSTVPTSCPTTSSARSASPPARRRPRSWSRRSSPASAPVDGVEEVRDHRRGRVLPAAAQPARPARGIDGLDAARRHGHAGRHAMPAIGLRPTTAPSSPPTHWLPSRRLSNGAPRWSGSTRRPTVHYDCELHTHGRVHRRAVGGDWR